MVLMKNFFQHSTLGICLLTLLLTSACSEKKAPPPAPIPQAPVAKTSLQVSQLMGLTINGQDVAEVAAFSPDPQLLEADDLAKALGIKNDTYLESALKTIQSQLQTGTPLKNVSVFLGSLPEKYAAECIEDLEGDLCLIEPVVFNCAENLEQKNWSDENYTKLCRSLGRLKAYKPEYLVAVFDGDNTMWYQDVSNAGVKKGVDSKRVVWDVAKAELLSVYPSPTERAAYTKQKTPYDYYQELYKKAGPLWNYNFAALAFKGLPLKETFANFQEFKTEPYGPIPFPEMSDLLKYLNDQGMVAGVVSASPVFGVYPMVESLNSGISLDRMEGLDVFIKDPKAVDSLPIRLSRLINQGRLDTATGQVSKFNNYQEVLETYGDWIIVDVDQVINARGGKGVQSRSIARRHVADRNRKAQTPGDRIDIDDMRLILIGGDNFAAPTDIENPQGDRLKAALEGGNDQGMSEGLPFLEKPGTVPGGTDIVFIRRYELGETQQVTPKKGKLENFEEFVAQQKLIRPTTVGEIIVQGAITDVKAEVGTGGFLKTLPTAVPESAPSTTETQPGTETQGTPETAPSLLPPTPTAPATPLPSNPEAAAPPSPAVPTPVPPAPPAPPAGSVDKLPPLPPSPPSLERLP